MKRADDCVVSACWLRACFPDYRSPNVVGKPLKKVQKDSYGTRFLWAIRSGKHGRIITTVLCRPCHVANLKFVIREWP